jgi:predicted GNAT superfamily acetyltransferase
LSEAEEKEHAFMAQIKKIHAIDGRSLLDRTAVLSLNSAHSKETSVMDETSLAALLDMAFYARGIERGATAFLIALDQNASYWSPNFRWFQEFRKRFVYIDRIIVAVSARGQGIARILYEDLFVAARQAGQDRVVCEVNIDPPNPASEAFHLAMGFEEVGQATIHGGAKKVRYFEKMIG